MPKILFWLWMVAWVWWARLCRAGFWRRPMHGLAYLGLGAAPAPRPVVYGRRRKSEVPPVAGHVDARHPRRKPDWVLTKVLQLAVHLDSSRAVAINFNRLYGKHMTVGKTWVHEQARRHKETIALMRRDMKAQPPRSIAVNQEWGIDLTTVRLGRHRYLVFAALDHGSRLALRLQVLTRKCTWTLLSEFCAACAEHGPPLAVRTDNEAMFTSRLWVALFRMAGIQRQRIDPGCPWQNGRIERFFGTLKPLLRQLAISNAAGLQMRLDEFAAFYNEVRVHQSLGGLTPADSWNGQTIHEVRQRYGKGCWVHALDGLMLGYRL